MKKRLQEWRVILSSAFPSASNAYWRALPLRRMKTLLAGGELRQIERTLKLKMERLQSDTRLAEPSRRMIQNTLASRTLTALPGEVFV
jgi:hypothetical protein